MDTESLISQAEDLQEQAYRVLEELALIPFLTQFGPPVIVGSLALGLMTWPDIDIDLVAREELNDGDFWHIAQYLLGREEVNSVTLIDNRAMFERDRPQSMYIGVRYQAADDVWWKLDIRYLTARHAIAGKHLADVRAGLTDEKRCAILRIKHVLAQDPRYGNEITSVDIYTAVLKDGIMDLVEFEEYWNQRLS